MATTEFFNTNPYYDDHDPDNKFLRVLFWPGRGVQARELTQLQSMQQEQIRAFGNHVFKDGSIVSESSVVLNPIQFVRITGLTGYAGVSIDDFEGLTASVAGKNTIKVLHTLDGLSGSNVDTSKILFFSQYANGPTGFALGDTVSAILSGTTITATVTGGTGTYDAGATHSPAFGSASLVGLDEGIRYIKGFFVRHDTQKVVPYNITGSGSNTYRKFDNLEATVKITATDTIVTATDDNTLNDPAFGSYNYAAPGADRYMIDLSLDFVPLTATADYTLINIDSGQATFRSAYPEYNVLADTLARRTYDESGNYTVEDFPISIEDHDTDNTKLNVKVGKGKAYVFGHEFVNNVNQVLTVDKPRTARLLEDQSIPIVVGSQLNVQFNPSLTATGLTAFDIHKGQKFLLSTGYTSAAYSGIGYLRLQNANPFDGAYVANVYDIVLANGLGLSNAHRLFLPGLTGPGQHIFDLTDSQPSLLNPSYSSLVFPLSNEINSYAVTGNNGTWSMNVELSCTTQLSSGFNTFYVDTSFGFPNFASMVEFSSINDFKVVSATGATVSGTVSYGANTRIMRFNTATTGFATVMAKFLVSDGNASGEEFKRAKSLATGMTSVRMQSDSYEDFAYLNGMVDVYSIISITGQFGAGGATSMTNMFDLDTGMRDSIYDWSRIVVKPQYYGAGITAVSVTYKKFNRVTSSATPVAYSVGPFTAKSYIGMSYDTIPVYAPQERGGKPFSLAGAFDFRPDRQTPAVWSVGLTPSDYGTVKSVFPTDISIDGVDWRYYYPRTDKIVLGKDREFRILTGIETDQAPAPADTSDAMTLGTLFMYPWCKSKEDTILSMVKNRRYTMQDIGVLEKRIDRVEYYTALTLAEKSAASMEITDENGLNRFKNGIFVDSFESRSSGDYANVEHLCSIDPENKEVRPRFQVMPIDYSLLTAAGATVSSDGIITLDYDETPLIEQKLASKAVNVNPFNVTSFNGQMLLSPSSDDWVDTQTRPSVVVNLQGENDGLADSTTVDFGVVWNSWETNWTGKPIGFTDWSETKSKKHSVVDPSDGRLKQQVTRERFAVQETSQTRNGIRNILQAETLTRNVGNRVVDVSVIPFMRAATITVTVKGLRPNVRVYPFFDGVDVSSYVSPSSIIPNAEGTVTCTFSLPAGIFKTGERMFRLIDSSTNNVANATSVAETFFRSQGLLKVEEGTIVSTRAMTVRRESVVEERVFNNIVTDAVVRYVDPVAQTFLIDPLVYPNGLFLASLDLFFKTKASGLPVFIQLRPVVNGYPSSANIIPFSEVYKSPSDVNVSEDGSSSTNFKFTSPVYLLPGEYAITVLSNSDDYTLWVSEVGQTDVLSDKLITSQPYAGSFFKSQNSSTWTAEQTIDLKFTLNRCSFDIVTPATPEFRYTESSSNFPSGLESLAGINVYRLNHTSLTPAGTALDIESELDGNLVYNSNQNYYMPSKVTMYHGANLYARFGMSSENELLSPVIDADRVSGLYVFNIIQTVSDIYKDQNEQLYTTRGITQGDRKTLARYLSKKINLQQGFQSDSLDVYMATRLPYGSDVRVYMRTQLPNDNTPFEKIPFEKMTIHPDYAVQYGSATGSSQYVSANDQDYVDLRFTRNSNTATHYTSGITSQSEFKAFQVKVVMYGNSSSALVPAIKDLRAIAT